MSDEEKSLKTLYDAGFIQEYEYLERLALLRGEPAASTRHEIAPSPPTAALPPQTMFTRYKEAKSFGKVFISNSGNRGTTNPCAGYGGCPPE